MLDKHLIAKTDPVALQGNMVLEKDVRITVLTDRLISWSAGMEHCMLSQIWLRWYGEARWRTAM